VLDEQQALAARKEDALNALSQIASKFRTRAGESLATIQQHQTPLVEATTPSIEALKAYSTGMKVAFSDSFAAAVPHLKRAIEIDPKFAAAYAQLGLLYSDIGESVLATDSTIKAYQLRDRASDPEKFFIIVNYERQVTGNLDKARQTCELWTQTYPRDPSAHALLAGLLSQGSGQYQESIDEANKALSLDPDFTPGYVNLAYSYFWLDRPGDAQNVLRSAAARQIEMPELLLLRYDAAFLRNDRPGMDREVALAQGKTRRGGLACQFAGPCFGPFRSLAAGHPNVKSRRPSG
jgi:eukaryotic-like serine/threonine-protein kinase